ncbi:hypothetical protein BH24GEM2_BH24GEM2_12180 [soil metagenome]|jgi:hypothetical protein
MQSLLKPECRDALWRRTQSVRPDTPARWGQFTAPQMLAHLIQSLRMTSGDLAIPPERAPWVLCHAPLKHLLIYVLPFPKGMSTFPELLAREAADPGNVSADAWTDDQQVFRDALDSVGTMDPAAKWPDHGAFGPLTGREWGVLQYRHLDHHLRQFGC